MWQSNLLDREHTTLSHLHNNRLFCLMHNPQVSSWGLCMKPIREKQQRQEMKVVPSGEHAAARPAVIHHFHHTEMFHAGCTAPWTEQEGRRCHRRGFGPKSADNKMSKNKEKTGRSERIISVYYVRIMLLHPTCPTRMFHYSAADPKQHHVNYCV